MNAEQEIIYVGKAKNLKNRVSQYFVASTNQVQNLPKQAKTYQTEFKWSCIFTWLNNNITWLSIQVKLKTAKDRTKKAHPN